MARSFRKELLISLLFTVALVDFFTICCNCQSIGNSTVSTAVPASTVTVSSNQVSAAQNGQSASSSTTAPLTTSTQSSSVTPSTATINVNSSSSSPTIASSTSPQTAKAGSETATPSVTSGTNQTISSVTSANSTVTLTTAKPKDCNEQLLQVDGCIKRIVLIGDREAVIPKTVKDLEDNHCNRIKGELICVREYGRVCLKLFPRTIFTIVRKNVEKVFKSFCTNEDGKATAVKHLGCFKPENLIVLHSVMDKITHTLQYIERNATENQIIPYMCCAFYTFYRETQIIVDNMCLNTTGPGTSEFVINIIKAVVTDALDLGCGQYGSYKKCTDNLPDGARIFTQIFQHDQYGNSTYTVPSFSPVIPMIAISKRLDSGF